MMRLEMKTCNMILAETQKKYQHYYLEKLINVGEKYRWKNTGEKILSSDQRQIIEQAKFAYSPLGKAFENQPERIENQVKNKLKL